MESAGTSRMRWLLVGGGSIGKRHLGNLQRLGVTDLVAYDPREDRRREVAERFGVPTVDTLEAGLASRPQVACICTPTRFHLEQSLAAARAGCHLFIEKPVAETLDGVDALLAEAARRGLVTLVGCNFRFHPGLQRVRSVLATGELGTVVSVRARFGQYLPDWHPWEDYRRGYSARRDLGGGVILDRIHEFDYLCWLFGGVARVAALAGHRSHLEIDTEDTVEALLEFTNGPFAAVHLDYVRRTYDCGMEVVGDQGTLLWSFQDHEVRQYRATTGTWESQRWSKYDPNAMYVAEMEHFLAALRGETDSCCTIADARDVLRTALAVKEAADRKAWISLDP